jgi:hypothetical protein
MNIDLCCTSFYDVGEDVAILHNKRSISTRWSEMRYYTMMTATANAGGCLLSVARKDVYVAYAATPLSSASQRTCTSKCNHDRPADHVQLWTSRTNSEGNGGCCGSGSNNPPPIWQMAVRATSTLRSSLRSTLSYLCCDTHVGSNTKVAAAVALSQTAAPSQTSDYTTVVYQYHSCRQTGPSKVP